MNMTQPEPVENSHLSLRDELTALRDEVRLELHLAGMEAKDAWRRLEPRVREAEEKLERSVSSATHAALRELTQSVREFRESLRSSADKEHDEEPPQRKTGT